MNWIKLTEISASEKSNREYNYKGSKQQECDKLTVFKNN